LSARGSRVIPRTPLLRTTSFLSSWSVSGRRPRGGLHPMKKNPVLIAIALLVGCGAGAAVHNVVMPVAGAQAHGSRFQHHCTEVKWDQVLGEQEFRPELGAAGWELVTFVSAEKKGFGGSGTTRIVACFKREVAGQ